jgi:amidase
VQIFEPDDLKFTYSGDHAPIGTVEPGEVFVVETEDCFTGRFRTPDGFTPENLAWVLANLDGVTGPIAVAGATRGGAVAVTLHSVAVTTPGSTAWSTCEADSPADWWAEWYAADGLDVRDGYVHLGDLRIPARPLVGCIATAPDRETVFSKMQGRYGGNMDCNEVREGATVVLPVEVDGAYLYFGDSKARMGDGEVVQSPEVGTRLEVSVEAGPRPPGMGWPRILSGTELVTVVSARTIDEGSKLAFAEMLTWCTEASGLSRADTAQVLGMLADVGICQVANFLPTARCKVNRAELPWPVQAL